MRMDKKAILPIAGATMAAGAAIGMMMMPKKKKHTAQKAAGRAIKAVGEVVEHFNGSLKKWKEIWKGQRGEGYIDTAVLVLCAMLVIAIAVRVYPVYITKLQLDISGF